MLGEPAPNQADLKFSVLGIPVRVSPWFWAIAFLLGIRGEEVKPEVMIIWVIAVFISVLVHELGHALTARRFGNRPWITLHGMGGLASYNREHESLSSRLQIIAAGPGAGFLFATLIVVVCASLGRPVHFRWSLMPVFIEPFNASLYLNYFIYDLLFVNIMWGIFNLLPIYPLDGGQIARLLWLHFDPWDGIRKSLILSIMACIFMAIWFLMRESKFMPIMMAWMGYNNFQQIQAISNRGGYGNRW